MPKKTPNIKGVALVTVIIFLVIIASIATAAIFLMSGTAMLSAKQVKRIQAQYAAEAGAVHGLEMMRNGSASLNESININGFTVNVTASATPVTIGGSNQYSVKELHSEATY